MAGSGLEAPRQAESTTAATSTPGPGPTWQVALAASLASTVPSELLTTARGTPAWDRAWRAARAPGTGWVHTELAGPRARTWRDEAAASTTAGAASGPASSVAMPAR